MTARLVEILRRQARRLAAGEARQRPLAATALLGTLGLVFVLPVVAGAYLGLWLDQRSPGYSLRWTLGFILLGVVIGASNVYFLLREADDD
ncbi:MAG: F0F1 ATP synthase subunit [Porticoccaceae bacterium]|nr:MAG: F0F1 ATP synthase subunit [Porticoccaceae bacterium]